MNEDTLSKMLNSFRGELATFASQIQMLKRDRLNHEARICALESQMKKLQIQANDNSAIEDDMVNMGNIV